MGRPPVKADTPHRLPSTDVTKDAFLRQAFITRKCFLNPPTAHLTTSFPLKVLAQLALSNVKGGHLVPRSHKFRTCSPPSVGQRGHSPRW
jgi:hypothetical protein